MLHYSLAQIRVYFGQELTKLERWFGQSYLFILREHCEHDFKVIHEYLSLVAKDPVLNRIGQGPAWKSFIRFKIEGIKGKIEKMV